MVHIHENREQRQYLHVCITRNCLLTKLDRKFIRYRDVLVTMVTRSLSTTEVLGIHNITYILGMQHQKTQEFNFVQTLHNPDYHDKGAFFKEDNNLLTANLESTFFNIYDAYLYRQSTIFVKPSEQEKCISFIIVLQKLVCFRGEFLYTSKKCQRCLLFLPYYLHRKACSPLQIFHLVLAVNSILNSPLRISQSVTN